MERPCYNNPFTYDPDKYSGEVNNLPSETVPSRALSVEELFYRFARGLPTSEVHVNDNYGDDLEQSEDNFDVHPLNSFDHDILDILPPSKTPTPEVNTPETTINENATTINDDANTKEVDT